MLNMVTIVASKCFLISLGSHLHIHSKYPSKNSVIASGSQNSHKQ